MRVETTLLLAANQEIVVGAQGGRVSATATATASGAAAAASGAAAAAAAAQTVELGSGAEN